jgi:hypothetical protein
MHLGQLVDLIMIDRTNEVRSIIGEIYEIIIKQERICFSKVCQIKPPTFVVVC